MNNNIYHQLFFKEVQKFRQWWLLLIIFATCSLPWIGMFYQVILGNKIGDDPSPDWFIILIWLLFGIGIPLLFIKSKLITEIKKDGIYIKFFPFHINYKFFAFDEIEKEILAKVFEQTAGKNP